MIKITLDKKKVLRSLKELENEFNNGNIPKSHYETQKRQLEEQLDAFTVADRVRRLQGKETAEVLPEEVEDAEEENEELFKKYITSPGLKEKNLEQNEKSGRISQNAMIALALLVAAFIIGIAFGSFNIDLPTNAADNNLFANDSAFPPYVVNNTTNMTNLTNRTNMTNMTRNTTKIIKKPQVNNTIPPKPNNTVNNSGAGSPNTKKSITIKKTTNSSTV